VAVGVRRQNLAVGVGFQPAVGPGPGGRHPSTLLGHAAHQVIGCLAALAQQEVAHVNRSRSACRCSMRPSLKAALDIDWADADQKHHALQRLCDELDALQDWIGTHFPAGTPIAATGRGGADLAGAAGARPGNGPGRRDPDSPGGGQRPPNQYYGSRDAPWPQVLGDAV